jgi:GNAT superfamily N-acetyltransferase
MTPVTIREAADADLADVLRLYRDAEVDGGRAFTLDEARAKFAELRRYPSYRIFVAVRDGVAAGTYALILLDNLNKRGTPVGVIEDVAVLPEFQGQGIGRAMMLHAREECRRAGCYKMMLSSNVAREDAHRFYDSLGFERHGYSFRMQP